MEVNVVEENDIVEVNDVTTGMVNDVEGNGVMTRMVWKGMLNGSEWCHDGNGKWKWMVSWREW